MKYFLSAIVLPCAVIAALLAACNATDAGSLCPVPPGATAAEALMAQQSCSACVQRKLLVPLRCTRPVDILFVIDNSASMAPKQKALANAIPQFIGVIDSMGLDYHVGVVTTDLGYNVPNGTSTGQPFAGAVIPACNTAAGDDGVLQTTLCVNRPGLTGEAAAACASLCPDPSFVPLGGLRYILKKDELTNVRPKIVGGVDIGPQQAFKCMALVGDTGCGVTMPLEAARRALDDHRPENAGFNRGNSLLVIVFITDKDDFSTQLAQRSWLDPATPDRSSANCNTPTPGPGVSPQCFNVDYRCTASNLVCDQPMNTPGPKTHCVERADSFLIPTEEYAQFFAHLSNPDLFFVGIWPPTLLDNQEADPTKDGQLYVDYLTGALDSAGLDRGTRTKAACYNPDPSLTADPSGYFGQAQLRLSTFIRRFRTYSTKEFSICDANNYASALPGLVDCFGGSSFPTCLQSVPKIVNGTPECVVGYVDAANPGSAPDVKLPACSMKCCEYFATDPAPDAADNRNLQPNPHLTAKLAACSGEPDCYCAVPAQKNCGSGAIAGLWRKDNALSPPEKIASFFCVSASGCASRGP